MNNPTEPDTTQLNEQVLIYTFASARHYLFVAPCVFSALRSNPGVFVEIAVESPEIFMTMHGREFHMLRALFGDRFEIRKSKVYTRGAMLPHTVRFIETPEERRRYTYITDIDIFLSVDGFARLHLEHMARTGLPYSNMVRPGTTRLTGLHFTETDATFPPPDLTDINLAQRNDEEVLYEVMTRRGWRVPTDQYRPVHGVHFSLNRADPLGKDGSGIGWTNKAQWQNFKQYAQGPEFDALWLVLSSDFKSMVHRLRTACEAEWPDDQGPSPGSR